MDAAPPTWWSRLATVLDHPGLRRKAALGAMVLATPSLSMRWAADDWLQRAKLLGNVPGVATERGLLWDLFAFFPRDPDYFHELLVEGVLPWWTDPEITAAFMRPVAALTHVLDYAVAPHSALFQHAHSILWLGLAVLAVGAFFRAWLGVGRAAALATLCFALDDSHAWPVGWLANRNALVAATFGALGLYLHLRGHRWTGAIALCLGLFSAEMGTGAVTTLVGIELFAIGSVATRFRRLVPAALASMLWATAWVVGDFGVHNSGLYLDPLQRPLAYLAALPERSAAMLATQWLNAPLDFWMVLPPLGAAAVASALFALTTFLVFPVLHPVLGTPLGKQALAASLLSVVPVAAGFPMDRMVMFISLGAFALLGMAVQARLAGEAHHPRRVATLATLHLPVAATMFVAKVATLGPMFSMFENGTSVLPREGSLRERDLVILGGMEVMTAHLPMSRVLQGLPAPRRQALLVPAGGAFTVTREGANILRVDSESGLFRGTSEKLCRDKSMFTGDAVDLGWYQVEVLADRDGHPTTLRYSFDRDLDDPSFLWANYRLFGMELTGPPVLGQRQWHGGPAAP